MAEYIFTESLCKGRLAFDRIAKLQNFIINCEDDDVVIRVRSSGRVGLTFVFMLATLHLIAKEHGKNFKLYLGKKIHSLYRRIQLGDDKNGEPGFHRIYNENDIISLVTKISIQAPVELDEQVADILVSKIGEMFINAFEHSNAPDIVVGKYFKHQRRFCFTCYDNGIGLTNNVRRFFDNIGQTIPNDIDALRWALKNGNTTKMLDSDIPRGLGLTTLLNFAKSNDGAVRICSGHALYIFNSSGEHYFQLENNFKGTLFEMDIITDNKHKYILRT